MTDLNAEGLAAAAIAICDPEKCVAANEPDRHPCNSGRGGELGACDSYASAKAAIRAYLAALKEDRDGAMEAMEDALRSAETVMMMVEPRSHKAEYLTALIKVRVALRLSASKEQGWIEWNGGVCPVAPEQYVHVRTRYDTEGEGLAKAFNWKWSGGPAIADIVAYRIARLPHPSLHKAQGNPERSHPQKAGK